MAVFVFFVYTVSNKTGILQCDIL